MEELARKLKENELSDSNDESCSRPSSDDEQDMMVDDDEEDYLANCQVKGLFCDKIFNNVKDLFRHEFESNNFNIIDVLKKFNMGMIDYIKMINFIRAEVGYIFSKQYQFSLN